LTRKVVGVFVRFRASATDTQYYLTNQNQPNSNSNAVVMRHGEN
jgi:hypothetical protein